jgi:Ca-activated chloride channel homolog
MRTAASKMAIVIALSLAATFVLGQQNTGQQNTDQQNSRAPAPPEPTQAQPPASTQSAPPPASAQTPSANDAPAADSPANGQQDLFVFKRQVDEVVLHATVVDEQRRLAAHLDRSAFTVFDNGVPQTITSFHREDVPVAIGIVIDNSSSMRTKRDQVNQAVLNLIRASNPQDQVFVVNFTQSPYLDQDFTSDINLLERALQRTSTQGSTALYDAIVASAMHLKSGPQMEKKILLVITDGKDNMSQATLQEAARYLQQRNGPVLYAIGLTDAGRRNPGREALQSLADATGGTAFFPASLDQVGDITEALAHDIRSQYTLAYKPQNQSTDKNYHPIVVEAKATGYGRLTVRTRNGYYTGESVR